MGFHGFFDLETRSPEGRSFRQRLRLDDTDLAEVESLLREIDAQFRGEQGGRRTITELKLGQLSQVRRLSQL